MAASSDMMTMMMMMMMCVCFLSCLSCMSQFGGLFGGMGGLFGSLGGLFSGGGGGLTKAGPGDPGYDMLQNIKRDTCRACSESGWTTYSLEGGINGNCTQQGYTATGCASLLQ